MEYSIRKNPRLKEYDYSGAGAYFITICTSDRKQILSEVRRDVVCAFKSITTKTVNHTYNTTGQKIWQRSFYDHIIRDEADDMVRRNYMEDNPYRWFLKNTEGLNGKKGKS